MRNLNPAQAELHRRAVYLGRAHRRLEAVLVATLQEVEQTGLWRKFDCTSLFRYAVAELGLSESVAYALIAVARRAASVPALGEAVAARRLTVSAAARIVSCLTLENASEVIEFAATHSSREVEWEVARRNPKSIEGDRSKPVAEGRIRITVTVSRETHEALRRVQSLEARRGKGGGIERALEAAAEEYLERRDPVRAAGRAKARAEKAARPAAERPQAERKEERPAADAGLRARRDKPNRTPLTAVQRHAVHARDGGRCAHVGESGKRCGADRFVDVHHVRPVCRGGGNEPENLTTLCSVHHDLVHQTSFPIDGQVSWLRATGVAYVG